MRRYWFGIATFAILCFSFAWAGAPAEFKGHDGLVFNVAFSNDGKILATASFDGTVKLWDFATGKDPKILKGHTGPVYGLAFNNADSTIMATGGDDKIIKLWNPV